MDRPPDRLAHERRLTLLGFRRLAGVDEAGRGSLAGPVVAAAVLLPPRWIQEGLPPELVGLNDSKQLSAAQREHYYGLLVESGEVAYAVCAIDAGRVDQINILRATTEAMAHAVKNLQPPPDHLLVDGRPVPALGAHQTALVKGDSLSYSIAAASVLAKVTRDQLMTQFDQQFPEYGFAVHKGYGTAQHLAALRRHGPCPIHRRTFAPLNAAGQRELF